MRETPMDNSDTVWQWRNARAKLLEAAFLMGEIAGVADGFRRHYARRRTNASSVHRLQTISGENALKSADSCFNLCLPVQDSSTEIDQFKNAAEGETNSAKSPISVWQEHVLSSYTNSAILWNHPHHDSNPEPSYFSVAGEIPVQDPIFSQKFQRKHSESNLWRLPQRETIEPDSSCIDEGNNYYGSWQLSASNEETSVQTSSCCCIHDVAEDMNLQSLTMKRQMKNASRLGGSGTGHSHRDWYCNHAESKKLRGDQNLTSEADRRSCVVKDQRGASQIAFESLHLLAAAAIRVLGNDKAHCPKLTAGRASSEQWIKKAIFFLTGEPFLQKTVIRRARTAFKSKYDTQNLIAANSKSALAHNAISKLGSAESATERGSHALHQVASRPKRSRSQVMPSKYSDSVLQPWKRGTRR